MPGQSEIPIKVVIEMEATAGNREIIDKYNQLVLTSYKEADKNGFFDDCTKDMLKELQQEISDSEESYNVEV